MARKAQRVADPKKQAHLDSANAWYARNRERVAVRVRDYRATSDGKYNLRKTKLKVYGLTPEAWDHMFAAQGKCCAVCRTDSSPKGWHTDHDHVTGRVRGILCIRCNVGIGSLGDNAEGVTRALEYLRPDSTPHIEEHW